MEIYLPCDYMLKTHNSLFELSSPTLNFLDIVYCSCNVKGLHMRGKTITQCPLVLDGNGLVTHAL